MTTDAIDVLVKRVGFGLLHACNETYRSDIERSGQLHFIMGLVEDHLKMRGHVLGISMEIDDPALDAHSGSYLVPTVAEAEALIVFLKARDAAIETWKREVTDAN